MKHEHENIIWVEIKEHPYFFTVLTVVIAAIITLTILIVTTIL
jgi:hypothetical protein